LQALTAICIKRIDNINKNINLSNPFLIVCPSSLIVHWENEINNFFPTILLKSYRYIQKVNNNFKNNWQDSFGIDIDGSSVVIVSYNILRRDGHVFTSNYSNWQGITLI
jgi:SNF2 family DNA or RNA helicase